MKAGGVVVVGVKVDRARAVQALAVQALAVQAHQRLPAANRFLPMTPGPPAEVR